MAKADKSASYHHGGLRDALLAAGRALLDEKGLSGFTLRECARRAGVSHAAPAHHFPTVDALLAEIAAAGFLELAGIMEAEAGRATPEPAARLVGQCVGYMAFAAANPRLFQLMFSRDSHRRQVPAFALGVEAVIPLASGEVKARMVDFAWSTVHGFVVLMLEGRIGAQDSARALKARGLAMLGAMVETVVRTGGRS